jgi:hypothetical protein
MMILDDWSVGNRVALASLALAALTAVARSPMTSGGDRMPHLRSDTRIELPALPGATQMSGDSTAGVIGAIVGVDPFQPARTRPAARFRPRVYGDEQLAQQPASLPAAATAGVAAGSIALQGIAHLANGGALAVLSVRGAAAQLVRVGQSLDEYRLIRVDSSSATIVGPDSTITLRLPGASAGSKP